MSTPSVKSANDTIPLGDIESELTRRWRDSLPNKSAPRTRACLSNLVVVSTSAEQAQAVAQAIPDIVGVHPARVLQLIADLQNDEPLSARINEWDHTTNVKRIWSEHITLCAGGHNVNDLTFAVRELLVGDLPVNLWWAVPTPPPFGGNLLFDLAEHAQQLLYDSIGWPDPMRGLAATSSWLEKIESGADLGRWRVAADLNWRRIRFWRRTLAQALDPNTVPGALESIAEVLVEHGPHAVIQAMELVGWLASRLGWKVQSGKFIAGVEIAFQVVAPSGFLKVRIRRLSEGPSELRKVRVTSNLQSGPMVVNVAVEKEMRLAVVLEGPEMAPRTVSVQHPSLASLVTRQISDRKRDPVFRASMAAADVFARAAFG